MQKCLQNILSTYVFCCLTKILYKSPVTFCAREHFGILRLIINDKATKHLFWNWNVACILNFYVWIAFFIGGWKLSNCTSTDYVLENTGYDDVGDSVEGLISGREDCLESRSWISGTDIVIASCHVECRAGMRVNIEPVAGGVWWLMRGLLSTESVREEGLEYYDDIITDQIDPKMTKGESVSSFCELLCCSVSTEWTCT